jgi:hypothetical protein
MHKAHRLPVVAGAVICATLLPVAASASSSGTSTEKAAAATAGRSLVRNSARLASSGAATDRLASARATRVTSARVAGTEATAQTGATCTWTPRNQWWRLRCSNLPVVAGQAVVASVSEIDAFGNEFIGDARISTYNVAVENGAVTVRVFIDWPTPLAVRTHFVW